MSSATSTSPPPARVRAAQERRGDAEGEHHRAHVVGHRRIAGNGAAVAQPAIGGHQPAARLDDEIHAGEHRVGPAGTERRDVADDEPGIAGPEGRVVEAELGGQPRAEIGEHHVGAGDQG
jgi:hypothetical protein